MPLVDLYLCDGKECESFSRDYIKDEWLAVPCISWYKGYKVDVNAPDRDEPDYKRVIVFDDGHGSHLFCRWECFEKFMHDFDAHDPGVIPGAVKGLTDGKAVDGTDQDVGSIPTSSMLSKEENPF